MRSLAYGMCLFLLAYGKGPEAKSPTAGVALRVLCRNQEAVQDIAANERNAWASLRAIAEAEADFRANDLEENRIQDFWTGDVAGLYGMAVSSFNESMKRPLNESQLREFKQRLAELLSIALADAAPLEAGAAGGKYVAITKFGSRAPKSGYYFRTLKTDNSEVPPETYQQDTEGQPRMGKVHHHAKFGFCAYPAEYGRTGRKTYIINEGNTRFSKDTQGQAVAAWPSDDELRKGEWRKVD